MVTSLAAAGVSAPSYALQSARREAQQAEQTARTLRSQAQEAQRSADQEQARADGLSGQASDAGQRSATARNNLSSASASTVLRSVPFVNASGQSTGMLLNAVA